MFDTTEFRSLMTRFPTGVSIVTAFDGDDEPKGMTCSSMCSVTLTPPTLLVCLRAESPTLSAVLDRSRFALNLLHQEAKGTAELFASGIPGRFGLVDWATPPRRTGPHLVTDAHAVADCVVRRTELMGDHLVVFGHVVNVDVREGQGPLLYGQREYRGWEAEARKDTRELL